MNIAVIGAVSMGKHRVCLLQQIDRAICDVEWDSREGRRTGVLERFGIPSVACLAEIDLPIYCTFIFTAPHRNRQEESTRLQY